MTDLDQTPQVVTNPTQPDSVKKNGGDMSHSSSPTKSSWLPWPFRIQTLSLIRRAALYLLILTIAFFLAMRMQFFDFILPATFGSIVVDTPQIFTRERLVNDRFREEAWLENQLKSLTNEQPLIASYDSFFNQIDLALNETTSVDPVARDKIIASLDKNSAANADRNLPLFPDQFQKLQRYRELVRRQLIENDLDDRHDLRSNSLFLFKFGATIAPGARTTSPVRITLNLEEGNPRAPLGKAADDSIFQPCAKLTEYECAYLYKLGRFNYLRDDIIQTNVKSYLDRIAANYDDWHSLYSFWINDENARISRRQQEYRDVLRDPSGYDNAKERAETEFVIWRAAFGDRLELLIKRLHLRKPAVCATHQTLAGLSDVTSSYKSQLKANFRQCIAAIQELFIDLNQELVEDVYNQYQSEDWGKLNEVLSAEGPAKKLDSLFVGALTDSAPKCEFDVSSHVNNSKVSLPLGNSVQEITDELADCAENSVVERLASQDSYRSDLPGAAVDNPNDSGISELKQIFYIVPVLPVGCQIERAQSYIPGTSLRHFEINKNNRTESQILQWHDAIKLFCGERYSDFEPSSFELFDPTPSAIGEVPLPDVSKGLNNSFLIQLAFGDKKFGYGDSPDSNRPDIGLFAEVPVGFFWFAKQLSDVQASFSYAVSPRADFDLSAVTGTSSTGLLAALKEIGGYSGKASYQQIQTLSTVGKAHTILGFSGDDGFIGKNLVPSGRCSKGNDGLPICATFGWFILPNSVGHSAYGNIRMHPRNEGLSALVSVPAWWKTVRITGRADWLNPDFSAITDKSVAVDYLVDLPSRTDTLSNLLIESEPARPWVDELKLGEIQLTACEAAALLLPGLRLWRSTVVTIGAQKSDLIQVMPDMGGIIAHFDRLLPQGQSGAHWPLVVWTSEGHVAVTDSIKLNHPQYVVERLAAGQSGCPTFPPVPATGRKNTGIPPASVESSTTPPG